MNWDTTQLLGESLPEFELLHFGTIEQAFWIKCEHCVHRHEHDLEAKSICDSMEKEWLEELAHRDAAPPDLIMEGTTVEGSEVATPVEEIDQPMLLGGGDQDAPGKKRRRKTVDYAPKRSAKKARVKKEPAGMTQRQFASVENL
jgi:hypothetical protein